MPLDILAFGPHPDDVELFAGGTLAKMASLGYAAGIVDMTRGEMGTRGKPRLRAREARNAARILGVSVRENLGLPDSRIEVTPEARLRVVMALRKHRPLVVLAPHWDQFHPDHANTGKLVAEAAHHAGLGKVKTGQERFRPGAVLYFMLSHSVPPSFVVDISEFLQQRNDAIRAYKSQLFDPSSREPATYLSQPDFLTYVNNIHLYYGNLIGRSAGEGFYIKEMLEIPDLVGFFREQGKKRFR